MTKRSAIASVAITSPLLSLLAWLYHTGTIGLVAIAIILATGVAFVAVTHYFYKRLWLDDEG